MLIAAIVLSLLGIAAFVFLFAHDFNIYWLILSPVIFAIYQFPAVLVFWIYKRKRDKRRDSATLRPGESGQESQGSDPV
jgi:membrane protein implicated in regulation of membrane protease activity